MVALAFGNAPAEELQGQAFQFNRCAHGGSRKSDTAACLFNTAGHRDHEDALESRHARLLISFDPSFDNQTGEFCPKKTLHSLAAGAALPCTSFTALAVNIGGLNVPLGPIFVVGQVGENTATRVGDTHTGSGKVESLTAAAATATSDLCAGCELTCQFNGYQAMSIDPTDVKFTGRLDRPVPGLRHQQRGHHGEHTGGSAADHIEATNGTLFPSLTEHDIDAPGNTVVGKG
ncbi:MAG: hypothetical protein H7306_03005, partial [Bacteriovorax sp.]|nr:hypothetical protein [Rhizobacter sp.]